MAGLSFERAAASFTGAGSGLLERGSHSFSIGQRRAVVATAVEDRRGGLSERFDELPLREVRVCLARTEKARGVRENGTGVGHIG